MKLTDQVEAGAPWRFFWIPALRPKTAAAVPPDPAEPFVDFGAPISAAIELSPIAAPVAVDNVASDRKTITFSAPIGAAAGLIAEHGGAAWLDLGGAYQGAVTVETILDPTTAVLAEALPFDTGTAGGSLEWRVWYADLTAEKVGDAVARRVRWSVSWESDPGADHPGAPYLDRGLVDIVRRPFDTGLTSGLLVESFPLFRGTLPAGQTSFEPQIRAGLRELLGRIEVRLPEGAFLDQLDGGQFQNAHALFTAHVIARSFRGATYDVDYDFLQEAYASLNRQFKRLRWLDTDDDGVVDAGETDLRPGRVVGHTASSWASPGHRQFYGEGER